MAYDRVLAERVRAALADHPAVREVSMFGGLAFMVNDKLAVHADSHGGLLVRCDPARADDLLGETTAEQAEMNGRTMGKGWLAVRADGVGSDETLSFWVGVALQYNDKVTR
jgi:hypothetical protein